MRGDEGLAAHGGQPPVIWKRPDTREGVIRSCDKNGRENGKGYGVNRNALFLLAVPAGFEPAFSP